MHGQKSQTHVHVYMEVYMCIHTDHVVYVYVCSHLHCMSSLRSQDQSGDMLQFIQYYMYMITWWFLNSNDSFSWMLFLKDCVLSRSDS